MHPAQSVCAREHSSCVCRRVLSHCTCDFLMYVCVIVCTCVSVQDGSGCFIFPFRVSGLAPNEPITGSSIW